MTTFTDVLKATLTEQEYRVLEKTAARLNDEAAISKKAAEAYLRNLTPIQSATIKKTVALATEHKNISATETAAFIYYGFI